MGLKDIILTPILFILMVALAFWLRPWFVSSETRKYFMPTLLLKFFSAAFIGLLYQFYYDGGDTFNYFHHSGIIWEAFQDGFYKGFSLLFRLESAQTVAFEHFQRMYWYWDAPSYFVCQVAGFFDLFTLHTYTSTALFFAVYSFSGSWSFFSEINKKYPGNTKVLAIVILIFPSVLVWGSGVLKDTLALGATFWIVSVLINIERKRLTILNGCILLVSFFILYQVKVYILIVLLPSLIFWRSFSTLRGINNRLIKVLTIPVLLAFFGVCSYFAATTLVTEESKYSLDRIAETTQITSYDIGFYTGAGAGSSYSLGQLDGTIGSMISKAPISIITSLFRPFLWEVRNPLMLLSSLEGLVIFLATIYSIREGRIFQNLKDPFLVSCLIFSIVFAFSVGFSYNFGTLVRYRIPMIAFYLVPLLINLKNESRQNSH